MSDEAGRSDQDASTGSLEPRVTVVIPTHERASLALRAVQSVLAQTVPDLEVLVVDDGSSDDTELRLRQVKDRRVRVIRHQRRRGGGAARNTGIDGARAPFVAFLDSDDVWKPDKLERQLACLPAQGADRCVVYSQVTRVEGERRQVIPLRGIAPDHRVAPYLFEYGGLMQTSTLLVSAPLAREVRFSESLPRHQDYDFCLRLEDRGATFLFVPRPLVEWSVERDRDRVSNDLDHVQSVIWAKSHESWSGRTRTAFEVREVLPRCLASGASPWLVAGIALRAVRHRLLPPALGARWVVRAFIPAPIRRRIGRSPRRSGS